MTARFAVLWLLLLLLAGGAVGGFGAPAFGNPSVAGLYVYDSGGRAAFPTSAAANARDYAFVVYDDSRQRTRSGTRVSGARLAAQVARGVDQGFAVGAGFRSFSQARRILGPAGEGQQWHHLVEQTPGKSEGLARRRYTTPATLFGWIRLSTAR